MALCIRRLKSRHQSYSVRLLYKLVACTLEGIVMQGDSHNTHFIYWFCGNTDNTSDKMTQSAFCEIEPYLRRDLNPVLT